MKNIMKVIRNDFTLAIGITLILFAVIFGFIGSQTYERTYTLVALEDTPNLNGSFFLGLRQTDTEYSAVFYYQDNDGIKFAKVEATDITIHEGAWVRPYVVFLPWAGDIKQIMKADFFVPPDSVTRYIKLDLKQ